MTTRRQALGIMVGGLSTCLSFKEDADVARTGGAGVSQADGLIRPTPLSVRLRSFRDAVGQQGLIAGRWNHSYVPSDWAESALMRDYEWNPANAVLDAEGALNLRLSERPKAVGQVQAGDRSFAADAIWEADIVVGRCMPGLIQAPLWLYEKTSLEEVNIEIVGVKGMTAAIAANVNGKRWVWSSIGYLIAGDLSGWAGRLAIRYKAGAFVKFFIDGDLVAEAEPATSTLNGGGFPRAKLKSYHQLWPALHAGGPGWAGRFAIPTRPSTLKVRTIAFRKAA